MNDLKKIISLFKGLFNDKLIIKIEDLLQADSTDIERKKLKSLSDEFSSEEIFKLKSTRNKYRRLPIGRELSNIIFVIDSFEIIEKGNRSFISKKDLEYQGYFDLTPMPEPSSFGA